MRKLTQKRLKELLHYDPETGIFTRKITVTGNSVVGNKAGCKDTYGYYIINIDTKVYKAHRLAWLYMEGYIPEGFDIDHIDRDPSNNKWENLRIVSRSCNTRNCGNTIRNSSGVKGVSIDKKNKKWRSDIMVNGKAIYLGTFKDFDDAVCARLAAEQYYKWINCDTNSPAFNYVKKYINTKAK